MKWKGLERGKSKRALKHLCSEVSRHLWKYQLHRNPHILHPTRFLSPTSRLSPQSKYKTFTSVSTTEATPESPARFTFQITKKGLPWRARALPWENSTCGRATGASAGASDKEPACQCRRFKRRGFDPWGGRTPPEEGKATDFSILAWSLPWTEEPGELQFMGSQKVGHD